MAVHGLWTRRGSLALWLDGGAPEGAVPDGADLPASWVAALARPARSRLQVLVPSGDGPDPAADQPDDDDGAGPGPLDVRTVRVVHVAPAEALGLMTDLTITTPTVGAELRWLADVAAVVRQRVGAGAVVPVLNPPTPGEGWSASWAPLPDAAWRAWLPGARASLPPALRAEVSDGGTGDRHPGGRPAAEVVDALAAALTDAVVRRALAGVDGEVLPDPGADLAPVTGAWVRALLTDEPLLGADDGADLPEAEVRDLAERVGAWAASASGAPVELVLRVLEPTVVDAVAAGDAVDSDRAGAGSPDDLPDVPSWALQVRLRSLDDPSLLLTAEQVRDGFPGLAWTLEVDPWAWTLTELARAGAAWPPLLADPADGGLGAGGMDADTPLEPAALLALVAEGAALLAEAGIAVQLPGRWLRPEPSLRLALEAPDAADGPVRPGGLDARALVDYSWRVALGGTVLTEAELRALAAAKQPLVRLRGEWVQVDPERLARSLAFLTRAPSGTGGLAAVMAQVATAALPEAVSGVEATGPLADLLAGRAEALPDVPVPAGLAATLRPYQERGLAWLASMTRLGLGAVLADDMGLGKTVQLLALLLHEHESAQASAGGSGPPAPTLLVCPMSLVGNWAREAARFAPALRVHVHHGPDRPAGDALARAVAGADLVLTTYAIAVRDQGDLAAQRWGRVALDEAQHVKNTHTAAARAVRAVAAGATPDGPAATGPGELGAPPHRPHRVALTGTPVENHLGELRSVLDFANPGVLGSITRFRERFAVPIERHGDERATAALATLTRPFVLRRVKTDPSVISDLPPKIEMTVHATLTAEQATLYQAVLDDMLARVEEARDEPGARAGLVLATLTRLKQVCNHPAQMLGDGSPVLRRGQHRSGKLALVDDVLDTVVSEGERALCFTQYRVLGDMLAPHLAARFGADVEFLHGGVPRKRREEMVDRFSGADGAPVLVVSLKAGGTGLNLVAANHVVHVDRWWNPAVEAQATDRAFRIGQTRTVQVRTLVCAGTVEERVDEMMTAKRALAASVVLTGEAWLTAMSTEQLREVLSLGADVVGER